MHLWLTRLAVAFAMMSFGMTSSGCTCSPSAATDGGIDAGVESGVDAGRDNRVAPLDTGPEDAGPDTYDGGPDDPGWVPLAPLPGSCVVERATHPERLLRNEWGDCGPGCEYLVEDERYTRGINRSGWHDGTRGYFSTNQGLHSDHERVRHRIIVLAATDGEVFAAWRGPSLFSRPLCLATTVTVGDGYAVFTAEFHSDELSERHVYYDRIEDIGQLERPTLVFGGDVVPSGAAIQRPSMSRHVYAAELQPAGSLLLIRPDGTFEIQRVAGNPQVPSVVGEDVFVNVFDGPTGHIVAHSARFGEGNAPFVAQEDAHIASFMATPDEFAWYVAYGPGRISAAERIELWTAPFTADRANLQPRFVRNVVPGPLRGYVRGYAGSGLFFIPVGPRFRLSDGEQVTYPRGAGRTDDIDLGGNSGYLWIEGGEIALRAVIIGGVGDQVTVRRDQISGLRPVEE